MTQAERDRAFMARCLELAAKYRGKTSPNPIVGCVIVNARGTVIAEGAHAGPGKDHGERAALRTLRDQAKGATLYVNLEPCNHHGRTPPCAPLVRGSGVARVVIGAMDPIPGHAGGAALLKKAKIAVTTGVLRDECERANLPFFTHARLGRPAFTLKAAITLDGKIATVSGESKWITSAAARKDVLRLRGEHDAILVGAGTVLADDPKLTARTKGLRDPRRFVLDRDGVVPTAAAVHPATIVTGQADLRALAASMGADGIQSVLVEGGGDVHAAFLAAGLADRIVLYVAPRLVGGPAKSWVGGAGVAHLADAYGFTFDEQISFIGGDLRVTLSARRRDSR